MRAESRADNLFTADQKICVLFVAACDLIAYNLTENVNVPEGNTVCVNLSFAMVLDYTTSPDYQLCVKQAR